MSLASLGWTDFLGDQLGPHEANLLAMRIATVHRDRMTGISQTGQMDLTLPTQTNTGDYAIGDWVLVDPHAHLLYRRLTRKTVLERRTQGTKMPQLAAANVDTLFIVTSAQIAGSPEATGINHGGGKGERGEMVHAGDCHVLDHPLTQQADGGTIVA